MSGRARDCELLDFSQDGIAFVLESVELSVGDRLDPLIIRFDDHVAYRGAARVDALRRVDGRSVIVATFIDGPLNVDEAFLLRDVRASGASSARLRDRPWNVTGYDHITSAIAALRLFFLDAERELDALEASLPPEVVHGGGTGPARVALIERVRRDVVDEVVAAYNTIGTFMHAVPARDQAALKQFSLRHLHEYFMRAPWVRRAREKPLGYPGDYELMNGLYGEHFVGRTLFAKAINMAFVSVPAAAAVRERKNLVRERLTALLDEQAESKRAVRILSIAAGPAQETFELLEHRERIDGPVEIVLFDQDARALGYAYARLERVVAAKWRDRVRIVYVHDSIKRLLRDPTLFSALGELDAIFSCGLFDYLTEPTAAALTANLYARLASGRNLYIGNQTPASTSRWAMEFHCEWDLIYRDHAEMRAFARAGAPDARIEVLEEPTGINPLVMLTRP